MENPDYIANIGRYLRTATGASGLLLHSSENPSPYSDTDFYLVFKGIPEKSRFTRQGKAHAQNIEDVIPGRLVLDWSTPFGLVGALYKTPDRVVKIDINSETMRSVQKSSGVLGSTVVFDETGRLDGFLGEKKDDLLRRNFYTPVVELQLILEQYYGFNWNALSKIWKGDYRLVAFEFVPNYLKLLAQLEHACNDRISRNYFNSNESMRPQTTRKLDEIEIRPQRRALIATIEKLQALFHDLGMEVAEKNSLVYPEEAEKLFLQELSGLKES